MPQLIKNKKIAVWGLVLVLVAGCCFLTSTSFAEQSDQSVVKIHKIQPPPTSTSTANKEGSNKPHYFIRGTIDAMGKNWITINDHQFPVARDAYLECGVGDFVGININDDRQVISCETTSR